MRLFHSQLFDTHLEGNGAFFFANEAWACLLSRAEALKFTCIVDGVSGSSVTFFVNLFENPTLRLDINGSGTNLLATGIASGTSVFTMSYSPSDAIYPQAKHLYIHTSIAGTAPKAHVRLWVCGRGPQLLEQLSPPSPSFSAQYAAARLVEDEGRLPVRKRSLPQGASLFYPPDLFDPSLNWER